ncbi:hypothetical protein QJQ45_005422 [Haematococcus lacustris]|nr:hypothetical protein QJQ45_005422 [Haematococcus lacustris]
MEDNIPRIVSETCRLVRELDSKSQVEPALIAYMACFQEVRGAIDVVAPGATLTSKMEPAQVSAVSQLLSKLLTEKDSPVLAATRMQVSMEAVFRQQRQIVEQEQAERAERVAMAARAVTTHVPGRDASAAVQDKTYSRVLEYVCLASSMDTALSEGPAKEEVRVQDAGLPRHCQRVFTPVARLPPPRTNHNDADRQAGRFQATGAE